MDKLTPRFRYPAGQERPPRPKFHREMDGSSIRWESEAGVALAEILIGKGPEYEGKIYEYASRLSLIALFSGEHDAPEGPNDRNSKFELEVRRHIGQMVLSKGSIIPLHDIVVRTESATYIISPEEPL